MTNPKSRMFVAVAGALSFGAAAAWAAEPTQVDARIQQLEAKVASLEAKQAADSKDLAATVDAVLRDAERRSQLLANGGEMGAGYDSGFYIRAGDAWVLRPGAQFQFRHVTNFRGEVDEVFDDDDDEDTEIDDFEEGFEVRRMKFSLEGTAFTPDLTYKFQWASDREGGAMELEDAWARYMFADQWGTRLGQFKTPVFHEELVSSKYQLAVDRSLVNELLGGGLTDYTQGVTLIYGGYQKDNPLAVEVGYIDGIAEGNTDFTDHTFDWGVAGRVDFKVMGDWAAYRDFSAKGTKEDLLVIGAGGAWSQVGDGDVLLGTVDAQWETAAGLGLYGALLVDHFEGEFLGADNVTDWGALVQAGYMLNPNWELFGRYDILLFDEEQTTNEDTYHEITVGVNYFLGQDGSAFHRAKFTVDLSYLPNGSPAPVTGIGILDATDGDEEWMLRAQFQLLI